MPGALGRGLCQALLTLAQLRLTPTPVLVVGAQGGITLGPEQGRFLLPWHRRNMLCLTKSLMSL